MHRVESTPEARPSQHPLPAETRPAYRNYLNASAAPLAQAGVWHSGGCVYAPGLLGPPHLGQPSRAASGPELGACGLYVPQNFLRSNVQAGVLTRSAFIHCQAVFAVMTARFGRTPLVSIDGMRIGDTMVDLKWVRHGFTWIGKA